MRTNLLEGFGNWLKSVGVDPKYGADQPIVLANVVLRSSDGTAAKYPQLSMFKVLAYDPKERWAKIQDVNYPDRSDKDLSAFPHGIGPSKYAGQTYLLQGKEFDKLIAPQLPAAGAGAMAGGMGGPPGASPGMPMATPMGTPAMPAAAGPVDSGFTGEV